MYFEIIINFGDNIFICLVLYISKCTNKSVLMLRAWNNVHIHMPVSLQLSLQIKLVNLTMHGNLDNWIDFTSCFNPDFNAYVNC